MSGRLSILDVLTVRAYGWTKAEAAAAGACISCRRPVAPVDLPPDDRAEYGMTALCPECFDALNDESDESDALLDAVIAERHEREAAQ